MGSSPGFGSDRRDSGQASKPRRTYPLAQLALFRLGFPIGSVAEPLNQAHDDQLAGSFFNRHAIRQPQPSRSPTTALPSDCLWATGFRFSFTPRTGVLFTFPSRYSFTIGRFGYLALERGRPCFPRDSSCPAVLKQENKTPPSPSPTGLSPSLTGPSQGPSAELLGLSGLAVSPRLSAYNPNIAIGKRTTKRYRFGLLPFRSPLLGESHRFLLLGVLRCFSSPACPRRSWLSPEGSLAEGLPSGFPIRTSTAQRPLDGSPWHFAALPRPSSAQSAQASTCRPK
jgi:hypothetical protein